ncbi:MAG TPA: DUF488 domain-containing protein [Chitinophagales bacterium]|nr:DUF488 domain-containing protein [Chitinophagales bacterium]
MQSNSIWTIGHSTRTLDEFIAILQSFHIELLADIRSYPGSGRFPHFNKEALKLSLKNTGIGYIHFPELGGRRKPHPDSVNRAWRNEAFRGYADYMQTEDFKKAISRLENLAYEQCTAYMCSEAVWWRCHRALVSDYLKIQGWTVMHIMQEGEAAEHPFTAPAKAVQGKLFYR